MAATDGNAFRGKYYEELQKTAKAIATAGKGETLCLISGVRYRLCANICEFSGASSLDRKGTISVTRPAHASVTVRWHAQTLAMPTREGTKSLLILLQAS
jgi:hypothetical protein